MNTKKLLLKLSKRFPKRYAKFYHDHVGLMTGKLPEEVHNILLCLDFDYQVFPLIKENKPDLIITHHPFIYGTRAKVFKWDKLKEQLCNEIDALGVPVYSMHTNFDSGKDGMNDALAEALGLQKNREKGKNPAAEKPKKTRIFVDDLSFLWYPRISISHSHRIDSERRFL